MNKVREKVLSLAKESIRKFPYGDYKLLMAFNVGADYFVGPEEENNGEEPDFGTITVCVEWEWLKSEIESYGQDVSAIDYLRNTYTWDDAFQWFYEACAQGKVAVVDFD